MIEIRNDDDNLLDEVVGRLCYVHLERMDEHKFCLIVDDGQRRLHITVGTPRKYRRRVNASVYEDAPSDLCMECLFSVTTCKCTTPSISAGT